MYKEIHGLITRSVEVDEIDGLYYFIDITELNGQLNGVILNSVI